MNNTHFKFGTAFILCIFGGIVTASGHDQKFYEVRDYTIESTCFEAYVEWAKEEVLPFFSKRGVQVHSFYVSNGTPSQLRGPSSTEPANGFSNISYSLSYKNESERNNFWQNLTVGKDFGEMWSKHPCPNGYLQNQSRFFTKIN